MRIDAHHHFWTYSADEYAWITEEMSRIRRNFLPNDLKEVILRNGIQGVVTVQARQSVEETKWLLSLAKENAVIRGVVGWVPLESATIEATLDSFTGTALKGVRHVVQGESDPAFLARADFNRGIRAVTERALAYDLLIHAGQLPAAIEFVDQHPNQVFVLDHAAKPRVLGKPDDTWSRRIAELARRSNVWCKFSGLVTEAPGFIWSEELIRPYFDVLLNAFGPKRLLFGSDWPVCLVASDYARWLSCVEKCVADLSRSEQADIFGQTAIAVYRLS